ncbi:MAG: acireductone synthase [Planctomycetaceae bacterium]|nr:acireductone synthase [Planctomycetaceae bacterium]
MSATPLSVRGVLLDIEGTTSSVRYVYDVLFPFALDGLVPYLEQHWHEPAVVAACEQIAHDAGHDSLIAWCGADADQAARRQCVIDEVRRLMASDVKATGLKALQGLIWQQGYDAGLLVSHVYDDVPPALVAWQRSGLDVRIYSSGSIAAQKVFFAHTEFGDLLPFLRGHYDTTTGPKREAASYRRIAQAMNLPLVSIVFCSDIPAELDGAREAGMQTRLVVRPGNAPVPSDVSHVAITSFVELKF